MSDELSIEINGVKKYTANGLRYIFFAVIMECNWGYVWKMHKIAVKRNLWSILNYFDAANFKPYYVNTSFNSLVRKVTRERSRNIKNFLKNCWKTNENLLY